MKLFYRYALALCAVVGSVWNSQATGWPANYEGVMLQGFYWDSYNDTKWTTLESQADELSKYFKLIWIPNSAYCGASNNMGYMPQYWFTNHNSSFGTEAQLRKMITTFKEKGTGMIADVVVNHRVGVNSWTDFPSETWRGKTYKLGPEHICSTDEVANQSGQPKPTGAPDTGDDFGAARDLDHTNATVQDNIKNYCLCLKEDFGYAGFRYDMVKGYGGQYTKIYNQYSKPTYSVGEYWDASYDAVAAWINATGKESAAFDFPGKYAINEAFSSNDMTKLVWKANGTTDQPAGMIHFGYAQYSVTFVDNHDTYRDGSKFNGNVLAANAFILCSPGTPCVFLPHWQANKAAIKALINVRNSVGVHNMSAVNVLQSSRDCYMAEVTGTKGKLVVKIGSAMVSPQGYSDSDIKASGNGYCVWTKASVGGDDNDDDDDPITGGDFDVYFDNSKANWTNPHIHYWGGSESTWPGVKMSLVSGSVWKYTVPAGTTGLLFNAGDGDATKTSDFIAVANHIYNQSGDQGVYSGGSGNDNPSGDYPSALYMVGTVNGTAWATASGFAQDSFSNGVYTWNNVSVDDSGDGNGYFTFLTNLDAVDGTWDGANQGDRYGAPAKDTPATVGAPAAIKKYTYMVDAMAAQSWAVAQGTYKIVADLKSMTLTLSSPAGVETVDIAGSAAEAVYFNLQGVQVQNPTPGLYIVRRGNKVTKEYIR